MKEKERKSTATTNTLKTTAIKYNNSNDTILTVAMLK
jgi:hypothetical protein